MILYYLAPPAIDGMALDFRKHTKGSSGFDLHANIPGAVTLGAGGRMTIKTGLRLAMPLGLEAQIRPRSGLARDTGIAAVFGSIDSDYRGEIGVTLINHGNQRHEIEPGDRIAQLVFACIPCVEVHDSELMLMGGPSWLFSPSWQELRRVEKPEELGTTERGAGGFGSTGR